VLETRFILIRHAESEWNAARRWQGHGDPPLSERGFRQAEACAEKLVGEEIDHLFCSDLLRTRQTAEAVGRALGLMPEPRKALRELEVGGWTGLTREEIHEREPELLERFESGQPNVRPGGGESRLEIRARVGSEVEALAETHPGKRLALVVHAGVIKALVPDVEPANCEVVEVDLAEIRRKREARARASRAIL